MYIYIYVYTYINNIHSYIHTIELYGALGPKHRQKRHLVAVKTRYRCTYMRIYVYMFMCAWVCICVCVYVYIYIHSMYEQYAMRNLYSVMCDTCYVMCGIKHEIFHSSYVICHTQYGICKM